MRSIERHSVTTRSLLFFLLLFTAWSAGPVMAAQDAGTCPVVRMSPNGNFCTANDVRVAAAIVGDDSRGGVCFPGQTYEVQLSGQITLTKATRYDIGLWVSTDGKSIRDLPAAGGASECEVLPLQNPHRNDDNQANDIDIFLVDDIDGQRDCADTVGAVNNDSGLEPLTTNSDNVINGGLDINEDGVIDNDDNDPIRYHGPINEIRVFAGGLDINNDGVVDNSDDGTWWNYDVIDGLIDVDGDGNSGETNGDDSEQNLFNDEVTVTCIAGPNGRPILSSLVSWSVPADAANVCNPRNPDSYNLQQSKCSVNDSEIDGVDIVGKLTINKSAPTGGVTNFEFSYTNDSPTMADSDNPDLIDDISPASPFTLQDGGSDEVFAEIGTGPATIVITESNIPAGWTLGDLVCSGDDDVATVYDLANNRATVTLQYNTNDPAASQTDVTCTFSNVKSNPGIQLLKTATPTTYDTVGQVISYSYLMTNSGNVSLFPTYAVTDDKVTVTCPTAPTELAPTETVTCTASHTITQADLDAGSISNKATGTAQDGTGSTIPSNEASETVTVDATTALVLEKTATPSTYSALGDVISYSYVMTNNGNVTLHTPYAVMDDKVTVTCSSSPGALAPSASVTCTASHTVTQADLDAGSIVNKATGTAEDGTGSPVTSNEATETVTANANPVLGLVKTATPSTYSAVGQVISYSYVMTNNGNVTLDAPFAVMDDKVTVTCPGTPVELAPTEAITCTASHIITQDDLDAGSIANLATGTAQPPEGPPVTSNEATETATAITTEVLVLDKTATPLTYNAVGQVISYSYVMTNEGNVTLFPAYAVTDDKVTVTCPATPVELAPTETVTCTASHTITQADLNAGSIVNEATGTAQDAAQGGSPVTSNKATETVISTATYTLTLDKTATPSTYSAVGDEIDYSYVLTNNGDVRLDAPFVVVDDKVTVTCPDTPVELAPTEAITCTASHIITQDDLDAGSIVNLATGTAEQPEGPPVTSNEATETVTAIATEALVLDKTATPSTYSAVGDVINYSYVMTNDGNVTLFPTYAVTDDKVTVSCPANPTPLAPAASVTCTARHTITQADLDAGSIVNQATGTAQDAAQSGSPVTSNDDTETVTAIATQTLLLDKTATPSTYSAVGQVISYSYVMTNNGNVSLYPAYAVADDKVAVTCPVAPATLAPAASVTCKASHTITQADLDAGSIVNKATGTAQDAAGSPVTSNDDTETVTAAATKVLVLDKTATPSTYSTVGDVISYSYVLTNNSNVTLFPAYAVADDKVTVTCPATPTTLAPSASVTCKASHTITQADLDAGSIVNKATGTAQDAAQGGSPVTSNEATETVTSTATFALTLDKTATPSTYSAVGDVINYSYVMTNNSNVTLFPAYTIADDKVTVTCSATPTTLAPAASVTCAASHTITQADLDAGSIVNKAIGTVQDAAQGGSPVTSNEDTETVTAVATQALVLDKTATPSTYSAVGDVISYSYVLTNNSNVTLFPAYAVADDKVTVTCPATPAILVPSASVTCTASHTITQADLDAGSIVNKATGTAQDAAQGGSPVTSNEDTETVTASASSALTLEKTATPETYSAVGDVIDYSYVLTNSSNVTLFPAYTVTDDKVTVTCPATPTTLAPSVSVTCTASHTVTQDDLDAGSIVNKATGTAQDAAQGGSPVTSNEDTATVTAEIAPPMMPAVPVPVNDKLALLLLTLMLLAAGWYFRPVVKRKF